MIVNLDILEKLLDLDNLVSNPAKRVKEEKQNELQYYNIVIFI